MAKRNQTPDKQLKSTKISQTENLVETDIVKSIRVKKISFSFKNKAQEEFYNAIDKGQICIVSGPAGTGKSFLSVIKAIELLTSHNELYKKIIIVKPAVEADEKLGALPGDVEDKLSPYTYSTFYILEKVLGKEKVAKMISSGFIEVMALAYMRGITIDNSIVIAEECQNMTVRQLKTFLTRIGESCKFILNGDLDQSDRFKNFKDSGLYFALKNLVGINGVVTYEFNQSDIVRNPIISKILEKFNNIEK
jgi:phosphate starvation-inducible protein PhoH and related proteins